MVAFIMVSDLKYYIVRNIEHRPEKHIVLFRFVSREDRSDIHMHIRYMNLVTKSDDIYMIGSIQCMDKSAMVSGVAEKELEEFGKIITQNLYNFYTERKAEHAKENVLQSSNNEAVD